ncbi:hypothetical protein TUM19329_19270 [Legionella antarctica]|uniref:SidE PDE domain-containing protein n=1 Tax=Legionella antarctica TaxID=2708020 RepID=A0A6F8T6H6_9GAMM|nr:hypothetical protein [Legionella antarctica]BCA95566.1 hypothetical protein TUM19329_19270 [Legionella antarctica]
MHGDKVNKLTKENFINKFQEMLEKYYLQPLDGTLKKDLKNGFIERSIHGAQHASRATLWALIMNKHLQKLLPEYVNSSQEKIANHIGVNVDEVELLILMTMGCHDAARKGEGHDDWESESAKIGLNILKELGLQNDHALLFSGAVQFKDNPDEYYSGPQK